LFQSFSAAAQMAQVAAALVTAALVTAAGR